MTNYRDLIESLVYCDEERHSRRAVKLIQQNPRKIEELLSKGFCINCRWFRQCNCSTVSRLSSEWSSVLQSSISGLLHIRGTQCWLCFTVCSSTWKTWKLWQLALGDWWVPKKRLFKLPLYWKVQKWSDVDPIRRTPGRIERKIRWANVVPDLVRKSESRYWRSSNETKQG